MRGDRQGAGENREPALLAGLFLLAFLLRLASFTGLIASDDLSYAEFARRIADGSYVPYSHHFAVRFGFIVPAGLIYALAGISEWSTIALPLVASSLSVVLLALIGARLFGVQAGLAAGLLYATFPVELRYATVFVPEAVAGCYVLLAVLAHVRTQDRATVALGALAGACIGLAYLTKEPALFVAPALFIDAALRRRWRQALGIAAGVAAVIAAEHAYYLATTGDLLFRFHSVAAHNLGNAPRYDDGVGLAYRLFQSYPRMMLVPNLHFGLHSLAALVLSAAALWALRKDRRAHFLLLWAALPWIYLNFGSSSLTHYVPIPVAPRYIAFAYPALFLLSAWLLAELASKRIWAKQGVVAGVAAVLLVGVVSGQLTRATGYRTDEVAVLRAIAQRIEREAPGCVRFDLDAGRQTDRQKTYWRETLYILGGGRIRECGGASGGVVIGRDRLGLPYVALDTRSSD
jgi:4-amino-4-deoxy-L-arabinose transferase-like glycosyltransferase